MEYPYIVSYLLDSGGRSGILLSYFTIFLCLAFNCTILELSICFLGTFNYFDPFSYMDQSLEVDRLYPALEIRQYLAHTLGRTSKVSNYQNYPVHVIRRPEFNIDSWTGDDDLEDIFTMSSTDSNSSEEAQEDTESLYCDALSRKASIVRNN